MKRYILLLCIFYSAAYSAEWKDDSFVYGRFDRTTTSPIPGCEWMKVPKSIKLSPQYPNLQGREWEPLPKDLAVRGGKTQPELGDMDNDGDLDLLITFKGKGTITILENIGTPYRPVFSKKKDLFIPDTDGNCTLGDIDSDGILDLMIDYQRKEIHGYRGIGDWNFERDPELDIKDIPFPEKANIGELCCELGDLDQDKDPDLIVYALITIPKDFDIRFYAYENKDNRFIRRPEWDPPQVAEGTRGGGNASLSLADLDNTKNPHILYTFWDDPWGQINTIKNLGTSSPCWKKVTGFYGWGPGPPYITRDNANATVALGDLDSDGDLDMLQGCQHGTVFALENIGTPENPIIIPKNYPVLIGSHVGGGVAFADLDSDRDYEEMKTEGAGSCFCPRLFIMENIGTPEASSYHDGRSLCYMNLDHYIENGRYIDVFPTFSDLDGDGKHNLLFAFYSVGKGHGIGGFRNISTETLRFTNIPEWDISPELLISSGLDDLETLIPRQAVLDLDNDKDYDIILITWRCPPIFLENIGTTTSPEWKRRRDWEENTEWNLPPTFNFYDLSAIDLNGDNNFDLIITGRDDKDKSAFLRVYTRLDQMPPKFERNLEYEEEIKKVAFIERHKGVDIDNDGDYDLATAYSSSGPLLSSINRAPHHPIGTYTSSIFDAGKEVLFNEVFWSQRMPNTTEIEIFIRYGDSINDLSSWQKVSFGQYLGVMARYIQYQTVLKTDDLEITPTLYEMRITYSQLNEARIKVDPGKGYPKDQAVISGNGFLGDIPILFGTKTIGTITAVSGKIEKEIPIPNLPPNLYPIRAEYSGTPTTYFTILPLSTITGYVRREDYAPIANAKVSLNSSSTTTNRAGLFAFSNLPIGTYTLSASYPGAAIIPEKIVFPYLSLSHKAELTASFVESPPSIKLKKEVDKKRVIPGDTLTYTISYSNIGSATATDVVIIEVLPENCRLQTIDNRPQTTEVRYWYDNKWQDTPSDKATKIKWLIPEVAQGASGTVSFTVKVE
ncbi:MAG: FG-GAP-like repeat-containing protein [bacterium]|nr:FG-GAP-like repeat-containing protein [bacterium]